MWLSFLSALVLAIATPSFPDRVETERTIILGEYQFAGVPASDRLVPAGPERWTVINRGRQLHQLHLVRVADSSALSRVYQWLDDGTPLGKEPGQVTTLVDILLVGASQTSPVTLEPGLYVAYCLVPTGERAANGVIEQHFMRGMRASFVVR
jgi:hypothetical protein